MDIIGIESTTPWGMKPANFFIDHAWRAVFNTVLDVELLGGAI